MTDEKDMAKQLKYRAGDVVTLKVARLGEMGAFLDAGTGDTSDDILLHKLQQTEAVEAYRMKGQTFDCGSKLGYLKAVLHYGVSHPVLGEDFKTMIRGLEL